MRRRQTQPRRGDRGFALMALLSLLLAGTLYFLVTWAGPDLLNAYRARKTQAALAQAREALIGFAITYRDAHPGEVFGHLPCPDTDNDGVAELNCGLKDVTVVGRLPWKTLGLPDLRDGANECLWYVLSGHFKYNPKTDFLNWDTTSRIKLVNADGQGIAASPGEHDAPVAIIIAPGSPLTGQSRAPVGTTICGGNNTPGAYLDGLTLVAAPETEDDPSTDTTVAVSTRASITNGTNNDFAVAVSPRDVFDQVRKRADFKNDVDVRLLTNISGCLNGITPLPAPSGSKGIDGALAACGAPANTLSGAIQTNWKDNLLYARPGGTITVNGSSCNGVLAFSGSRAATQTRRNAAERNTTGMYLTAANAAAFPDGVTGGTTFDPLQADQDLFICLSPSGPITVSFDNDIGRFNEPEGAGLSIDLSTNPDHPLVEVIASGETAGGCLWYPTAIPLSGRVVRVFYRSKFDIADPIGGDDEGYGFAFQMVRGDLGGEPDRCGRTTNLGALSSFSPWGNLSFIFETDIFATSTHNDPSGNHVAIMIDGNLQHSTFGVNAPSTACDGTRTGCVLTPANVLEESPSPTEHNHRLEIMTGCNSTCSTCSGAGIYARVRLWVDCSGVSCSDLTSDLSAQPVAQRCESLPNEIDQFYFGFTGGFKNSQSVRIWDFNLRSEAP